MTRFLPVLLLVCACAGSLVDHSGAGGAACQDGKLKCASGCCDATALSAGTSHTCAVASEEVRCWGSNEQGQLGRAGDASYHPVKAGVPGTVSAIAAGAAHTCAIAGGEVWCWGDNTYGQLGNGTTKGTATPQKVALLSDITLLAAGGGHTCAASATTMFCWGRDDFGQVGNGGTLGEQHLDPTQVINVSAPLRIAAGDAHTCAATSSQVLCWGQNSAGQLGTGAAGPASSTPAPVSQPLSASFLGLGANHSCAVASGGDLFCWGENGSNQLGVSASGNQPSPQDVMSNVEEVVAGFAHTCALRISHALRCWGANDLDQRGSGGGDEEHGNVFSSGVVTVAAAGANHTCAVAAGNLSCWGSNDRGQLGADPATTPSTATPTNVSGR